MRRLLAFAIVFVGCIPINFWQNNTVPIDATAGMPLTMSATTNVNLAQQTQLSSELKAVTALDVAQVEVQIANVQPDNQASEVSGSITISNPRDASWTPITLSFANEPVTEGGTITLTPDSADVDRLSDMLVSQEQFSQEMAASVSALPAHFDLTTKVHVVAYVDITKL